MENGFGSRLKHAWNAFTSRDPTSGSKSYGDSYYYRPDRTRRTYTTEKSIVTSVLVDKSNVPATINAIALNF